MLSDRQSALLVGPSFGVAYAAALPVADWLVDRVGTRRVLIGSVLVWTLGMVVSRLQAWEQVWARALPLLLLGRGITGVGQAAQALAAWIAVVLVRDHATTPPAAALLIGVVGTVASSIGPVGGGALSDSRRLGVAGAVIAMLALLLIAADIVGAIGLVRVQRLIPAETHGIANGLFTTQAALVGISGGPLLVRFLSADIGQGLMLAVLGATLVAAAAGLVTDRHARVPAR